ncbi:hypothetical protein DOT_5384 [Desulfosporosinus sp. OT]|nr:hypothetical protein DOT_5384 [Desulfosporosinus sp. OT]
MTQCHKAGSNSVFSLLPFFELNLFYIQEGIDYDLENNEG